MPMPYPPQNYNPQFDAERIRKATKVCRVGCHREWGTRASELRLNERLTCLPFSWGRPRSGFRHG
jgi:hypothetical protein